MKQNNTHCILTMDHIEEEHKQPLLEDQAPPPSPPAPELPPRPRKKAKRPAKRAIKKTFKATELLTKLLPTGSVLTFQVVSPILTNQGKCMTPTSRSLALSLLTLCGLSCFFQCLTDSFKDAKGKIRYGLATFNGLWVIDGSKAKLCPEEASQYRLRFVDLFHATMSALVFGAVALFDKNVVSCFFPEPTEDVKELLSTLPFAIGLVGSLLFLAFPTKRHGIGTPVSDE
ncbi:Protein DMP6 [Linum grandiflorum]